ncbi:glycoside hydrolase family 26 protein [Streptomyces sp. NPDC051366]|uniref:glycoside hydrolase family 26 protein n=1 Tax=Streptomyces sp. NPDC051366 TaxID=3365652 RepID=UPI003796800C
MRLKGVVAATLLVPLNLLAFSVTACTQDLTADRFRAEAGAGIPIHDVRPLLHPSKKYFGVSRPKAPHSMEPVHDWARTVGKQPNLIHYFAGWGDGFDASGTRNAWNSGAVTVVSWEPHGTTPTRIANGASDRYVREYAKAVRTLNIPIAISFADEMNGDWEQWGSTETTPQEYVRAWRHIHDLFAKVGATNVIWTWSPNIVQPGTHKDLSPYYPGDTYVDWVGLVGYFTDWDPHSFNGLFGATMTEIDRFSRKPRLLVETAAMPGRHRAEHVRALFSGIHSSSDIVGFAWFDYKARADWRLTASPEGTAEFRRQAENDLYGFDVRKVR